MKRPMRPTDLEDKGVPFACVNCGNRPTLDEVISGDCVCPLCGDEIIAYTRDTALMLKKLMAKPEPITFRTITCTVEEQENRRRVPWCSLPSDVQSYFEGARAAGMPIERLYLSTWSPDTFGVFVPHGVYRVGVKA